MKLYTSKQVQTAIGISRALLNYNKQRGIIDDYDIVRLGPTRFLYTESAVKKLRKYYKTLGTVRR